VITDHVIEVLADFTFLNGCQFSAVVGRCSGDMSASFGVAAPQPAPVSCKESEVVAVAVAQCGGLTKALRPLFLRATSHRDIRAGFLGGGLS
jgi:hypothetical protein